MDYTFTGDAPIYKQLKDQFKLNIATGKYQKGEKIPSVRELSTILRINPNTVQRALIELESEDLIVTMRTSGKYITEDETLLTSLKKDLATEVLERCIKELDKLNISNKEIISYIEKNRKDK